MRSNFLKQIWMTALAVLLVFYLLLQLSLNVGALLEIEPAYYTSAVSRLELTGYVFRDEYILSAPNSGYVKYLVSEGEKVSKNQKVSAVYALEDHAEKQEKVNNINKEIEILRQSGISAGSSTTKSEIIDAEIAQLHLNIVQAVRNNDIEKVSRYETELRIHLNRKQALISGIQNYDINISSLEAEKNALDSELNNQGSVMTSSVPGYFFSAADGYENIFTADALDKLDFKIFDDLISRQPDETVTENSAGKIITSANWFIAAETDRKSASELHQNQKYDVIFPYSSGETLNMTLTKKITRTDNDRVLLVFGTNRMPDNFNYKRSQTIEIAATKYEGLKIPSSALRVLEVGKTDESGAESSEMVYGVYVVSGNKIRIKKVKILFSDESYLICELPENPFDKRDKAYISSEYLSLYDAVVSAGRDLYEGKVLK